MRNRLLNLLVAAVMMLAGIAFWLVLPALMQAFQSASGGDRRTGPHGPANDRRRVSACLWSCRSTHSIHSAASRVLGLRPPRHHQRVVLRDLDDRARAGSLGTLSTMARRPRPLGVGEVRQYGEGLSFRRPHMRPLASSLCCRLS